MHTEHKGLLRLPRSRRIRAMLTVVAALALAAGITVPALAETATGTITGSLTDNGAPVAFAEVEISDADFTYSDFTTTDENGEFSFSDVPPNDYRMLFRLPGSTGQYWPQAMSEEDAGFITVTEGVVVTIDETVAPHGSITGTLTTADGSPAVNEQVLAIRDGFNIVSQATTDLDGRYNLPIVWPGTYIIEFGGFGTPTQWAHQKTSQDDADTFEVSVGETLVVDEQFLPTGAIAGQLTDANGDPVPYASVRVFNDSTSMSGSTDFEGNYRIDVRPGVYKIQFSADGIEQYAHQKTTESQADEFVVELGEDTIVNEQLLATGTITGTLRTASGEPVPDAAVYLYSDDDEFIAFTTTDEAGAYSVQALPGTYRLSFETRFGTQHAHGKSDPRTADPISVIGGETVVVDETLAPTGTITITARDSKTREPILEFCAQPASLADVCTDNGTVLLELLPGEYGVRAYARDPNYVSTDEVHVAVVSDTNVSLAFEIQRGATVTTIVRDAATGTPVEGACAELQPPVRQLINGPYGGFGCSDSDGVLTMTAVYPGTYNVWVRYFGDEYGNQWVGWHGGTGVQARARLIIARSGATVRLPDILLDPPGSISGVVTDAVTGEPVADTYVSTSSWSGGAGPGDGVVVTDSDGRYTLDGLGPYEWTLQFRNDVGYASHFSGGTANRILADTVLVRSGETTTYDTQMRKGTTVTGQVILAPGTNADFVRITAYHALTGDELGAVDPPVNGNYSLPITGPTLIRLEYDASDGVEFITGWYDGESSFREANIVVVPKSGTKKVNITIGELSP